MRPASFLQVLRFAWREALRHRFTTGTAGALVIGWTVADLLVPVFAGRIVDAVTNDGAVVAPFAAMIGLGAVSIALRQFTFMAIVRLTLRIMASVAAAAFARVQRFSTEWHADSFAGSTVRRISRGMWAFDTLNDAVLLELLPALVMLAGTTILLARLSPSLGAGIAVAAIAYVALAGGLTLRWVAPAARLSNGWDTRIGGALADAVSCNAVVKSFGAEAREDRRLAGLLDKWQRRTGRFWGRGNISGTIQATALLLLRAGIIGGVLLQWRAGRATGGDVATVLGLYFVVHGYLRGVGQQIATLQRSVNDMTELVTMQREKLGVVDRPGAPAIVVGAGAVAFEDVRFHYGAHATPLFDALRVSIRAGERVGLVGPSGSGKSTFVKLLQRLYDVNGGRITIDGQDIVGVRQESLRAAMAVVAQEPVLFHRSLAENIAYGRPGASQAAIEHAARLANAHDFIAHLPRGYGTTVGERGVKLSGGERQRVALARAFLADARLLVLDEATSSLDSESEALIQQAVERLLAGRTAIVIAHRLSTVRAMDRILVFDRGRVVEDGDHATLMRAGGLYHRLFERQTAGLVDA